MKRSNSGDLTLNLPLTLIDQIESLARARGTTVDELVTVALTGLVNYKIRVYDLTTQIQFTRYRGLTVEQVLRTDPSYIRWCVDNMKMELTEDATKLLREMEDVSKINLS